jgi:hypothetical protein
MTIRVLELDPSQVNLISVYHDIEITGTCYRNAKTQYILHSDHRLKPLLPCHIWRIFDHCRSEFRQEHAGWSPACSLSACVRIRHMRLRRHKIWKDEVRRSRNGCCWERFSEENGARDSGDLFRLFHQLVPARPGYMWTAILRLGSGCKRFCIMVFIYIQFYCTITYAYWRVSILQSAWPRAILHTLKLI